MVIFTSFSNSFAQSWIRPDTVVLKREIFWDIEFRPVLILPIDNKGEKGKNETVQIFPDIQ